MITFISMGIGSAFLLAVGGCIQGFGVMSWQDWGIVIWLALVNTAFAFTLWNHTLRTLTAVESRRDQQLNDAANCHPGVSVPG